MEILEPMAAHGPSDAGPTLGVARAGGGLGFRGLGFRVSGFRT